MFALAAPALARAPAPVAALLFAASWVAAEWLRCRLGLRSSWALLGASQSTWPQVLQVADLGGVYAVGAAIALVDGALAEGARALRAGDSATAARRGALLAVGLAAAVLAGVLGYGQLRLTGAPREGGGFEVAVVQGNFSPELRFRRSAAARALGRYARLTLEDAAAPPDLVISPESALQLAPDDPLLSPFLDEVLRRTGAPLLLGAPRHDGTDAASRHAGLARCAARPQQRLPRRAGARGAPLRQSVCAAALQRDPPARLAPEPRPPGASSMPTRTRGGHRSPVSSTSPASASASSLAPHALYPELARWAARAGARACS